jgi:hypothetical protein
MVDAATDRVVDLNKLRAARYEKKGPAPKVAFGKRTFTLPREVPFVVVEAFNRIDEATKSENTASSTAALLDAMKGLLGKDYDAFMAESPSTDDMTAFLEGVLTEYGIETGESEASPES